MKGTCIVFYFKPQKGKIHIILLHPYFYVILCNLYSPPMDTSRSMEGRMISNNLEVNNHEKDH
ncbi:hypothetical protein BpHYR1_002242 [Brachionus plicatilis]|uniref:Uncharacterized protein n=1 Tax=Brachionus plicatilis TaxID=10195 RepID=A0A3M7SEW5_BRAPC|nr:hypothetical protein BpHYR1_002242 [Brachionus plicatilis]